MGETVKRAEWRVEERSKRTTTRCARNMDDVMRTTP